MPRRSAPVDGFALEYDRAGSGPPVIALHGWPAANCGLQAPEEQKWPLVQSASTVQVVLQAVALAQMRFPGHGPLELHEFRLEERGGTYAGHVVAWQMETFDQRWGSHAVGLAFAGSIFVG